MLRLMTAMFALWLAVLPACHAAPAAPELAREVNAFIDAWHDDAANARMAYFDKIALDGVYIGTDRSELWTRDEFKAWSRRFFDAGKAWSFKATRRNVYASSDASLIWFDELLDTPNMGPCMASGVVRKTAKGFEIVHYQLSLAVPNPLMKSIRELISQHEKPAS